jgi:predicted NAD/FAD-binding protein
MKVAVVGAGWAGLTAAVRLVQRGHKVVVFEAARLPGGRARGVWSKSIGDHIDNGQHILLGAYTETLSLMRTLGLDVAALLHRERLLLETLDGQFHLHAGALPAPFHLLSAVVTGRGLGVRDRLALLRLVRSLQRAGWRVESGLTVAQWLDRGKQSPAIVQAFWQPLCLASLNTPPAEACAQLFANVLRDSVGGAAPDCDVLIPRVDLTQLWPAHVTHYAATMGDDALEIRYGSPVRRLDCHESHIDIDQEAFGAVVVAGNAPSTQRLLHTLPESLTGSHYLSMLSALRYLPIATLTLQTERRWPMSRPMLLLRDDASRLHFGQWLFDRSAFVMPERDVLAPGEPMPGVGMNGRPVSGDPMPSVPATPSRTGIPAERPPLLNIVISDARRLILHSREEVVKGIVEQITEQGARFGPLPRITAHDLIIEKRATFAAVPMLQRPANTTPWPRIWTAGDLTDTAYPGVLEGAVRSGLAAADNLMQAVS